MTDFIADAKALLDKKPGEIAFEHWQPTIMHAQALLLIDLAYTMTDIRDTLNTIARHLDTE